MKNSVYENNIIKYILFLFIAILISFDQLIKLLVENTLSKYNTVPIIPSVFHLTYVRNTGAAFGILQNKTFFLILVTAAILIGVIIFMVINKRNNKIFLWSLSLIISGGIGNLIDRIVYGYVIDYIDVRIINFAVFNLADSYVFIGVCFMLFYVLILEPKQNQKLQGTIDE